MTGDGKRILLCAFFAILISFLSVPVFAQDTQFGEETPEQIDAWAAVLDRVPESDRYDVRAAFEMAGTNAAALANALMQSPDLWIPGAVFLIKNMPIEDLAVVTEKMFLDNLRCAYEVRATYPWAANVSESDFLHYVLPMRVSQEPLENWRPYFLENIRPLIENATTLQEASDAALGWAYSLAGFRQTQRRDQGPFETIASGYGRCEELMILYIDACRAAGVPARQAWTPYWTYQDNNHAWTEILRDDGTWDYLDRWIEMPTKRTAFIFSVPFGLPDPDMNIYRMQNIPGARYAILNSIGNYRHATELTIRVVDINDNPMPETDVYLSIWNFGAYRPVATGTTNENGVYTITAGPGGYLISAGNSLNGACGMFQLEDVDSYELTLTVGLGIELPPGTCWLRYPYPEEVSE